MHGCSASFLLSRHGFMALGINVSQTLMNVDIPAIQC